MKSECGCLTESATNAVVDESAGAGARPSLTGPAPGTFSSRATGGVDLTAAPRCMPARSGAVAGPVLMGVGVGFLGGKGAPASHGEAREGGAGAPAASHDDSSKLNSEKLKPFELGASCSVPLPEALSSLSGSLSGVLFGCGGHATGVFACVYRERATPTSTGASSGAPFSVSEGVRCFIMVWPARRTARNRTARNHERRRTSLGRLGGAPPSGRRAARRVILRTNNTRVCASRGLFIRRMQIHSEGCLHP